MKQNFLRTGIDTVTIVLSAFFYAKGSSHRIYKQAGSWHASGHRWHARTYRGCVILTVHARRPSHPMTAHGLGKRLHAILTAIGAPRGCIAGIRVSRVDFATDSDCPHVHPSPATCRRNKWQASNYKSTRYYNNKSTCLVIYDKKIQLEAVHGICLRTPRYRKEERFLRRPAIRRRGLGTIPAIMHEVRRRVRAASRRLHLSHNNNVYHPSPLSPSAPAPLRQKGSRLFHPSPRPFPRSRAPPASSSGFIRVCFPPCTPPACCWCV